MSREKIGGKRKEITKKLQEHQKLIKNVEKIKTDNEKDARFMP
jgi:ABC-type Fe3+-citrate transport system substrate-binding protein